MTPSAAAGLAIAVVRLRVVLLFSEHAASRLVVTVLVAGPPFRVRRNLGLDPRVGR
jgi:hypothetical protein